MEGWPPTVKSPWKRTRGKGGGALDSEEKKCGEMEFSFSLFLGGSDMLRRLKMHSGGERGGGA